MRRELEELLFTDFHQLYRDRDPATSRMCDGFACGDGWFALIHDLSCKLEALGNPELVVGQAKQKMGMLTVYLSRRPGAHDSRARELIEEAETRSLDICELCGVETGPHEHWCADYGGEGANT